MPAAQFLESIRCLSMSYQGKEQQEETPLESCSRITSRGVPNQYAGGNELLGPLQKGNRSVRFTGGLTLDTC